MEKTKIHSFSDGRLSDLQLWNRCYHWWVLAENRNGCSRFSILSVIVEQLNKTRSASCLTLRMRVKHLWVSDKSCSGSLVASAGGGWTLRFRGKSHGTKLRADDSCRGGTKADPRSLWVYSSAHRCSKGPHFHCRNIGFMDRSLPPKGHLREPFTGPDPVPAPGHVIPQLDVTYQKSPKGLKNPSRRGALA